MKGKVPEKKEKQLPKKEALLDDDDFQLFSKHKVKVVAGTIGNDEHNIGIREILDIKHGGIEKYGISYVYLGTSVPPEKIIDAAIEVGAQAILASMIITHNDVHIQNMIKLHQIALKKE